MTTGHYRLETKIIGRQAKGKDGKAIPGKKVSVVAKAAYRSGQSLRDEQAEKTFNYRTRTQEVAYTEIVAPENAPGWLKEPEPQNHAGTRKQRDVREQLWNTIERVEKRKDSQLAREFIASLPRGLTREQQIELAREWCRSEFASKGLVADLAIHKSKNGLNPHAHVLVTLRPVAGDGFGKKPDTAGKFNGRGAAGLGAKNDLDGWRASWEQHVNAALEKAGREERVDRRSLKDRGVDRAPEPKIGVEATAMKRRGVEPDPKRFQAVRQVQMENEIRPFLRRLRTLGRAAKKPGRSRWLEQSAAFLSGFTEKTDKMIQGVKDRWTMFIDSRRANPPKSGPDLDR